MLNLFFLRHCEEQLVATWQSMVLAEEIATPFVIAFGSDIRARNDVGWFGNLIRISEEVFMKNPVVYMMTNQRDGVLYIGVTSNLQRRVYEHRYGLLSGFTKKYKCKLLVYYEIHETMESAIVREKQLKAGSRKKKRQLLEGLNPDWVDLYESIF